MSDRLIDVNVHLSRWPTRRLAGDETPELVARLRSSGVSRAWVGSFDGLLHRDIAAVNARLVDDCRNHGAGLLVPFGSVNPTLPDWRDDLRRCDEEHRMRGIRLHPSYHGYALNEPRFAELLTLAEVRGLIVQLAVEMEDERTQHPLLRVPEVDLGPLPDLLAARSRLRLVVLNGLRRIRGADLQRLAASGDVTFEIAMLEGVGGISRLLESIPPERVLFGSHSPFFCFEAARLKLRESELSRQQLRAISHGNAARLWSPR